MEKKPFMYVYLGYFARACNTLRNHETLFKKLLNIYNFYHKHSFAELMLCESNIL